MRVITPAQASIASLRIVLPDEAWPTMAKLRMSAGLYSFIRRGFHDAIERFRFEALRAHEDEFKEAASLRKRIRLLIER
jgi:hypothetical protein